MTRLILAVAVLGAAVASRGQTAVGTALSYQGELRQSGSPVNGSADLRFRLYNAQTGGAQVGSQLIVTSAALTSGRFTASLDFGAGAFGPDARWLEIDVRSPAGAGSFVTLSPRQRITAAPVAQFALAPWSLNGSVAHYNGGSVGVGTATPLEKLHVIGNVLSNGIYRSIGPVDPTSEVFMGWGTDAAGTAMAKIRVGGNGSGAYNGLDIQSVGNASMMRVLPAGVGIGTAAPNARLHVVASGQYAARFEGGQVRVVNGPLVVDGPYNGGPTQHAASIYTQTAGWGLNVTNVGNGPAIVAGAVNFGYAIQATADSTAVHATSASAAAVFGDGPVGVMGYCDEGGSTSAGVKGISYVQSGTGVQGTAFDAGPYSAGVVGYAFGTSSGWAGYFGDDTEVNGSLTVSGSKNFLIDNPANPEEEYLIHSCVESDEMRNMYDGVVTLGPGGTATVELPDWLDELNKDFRYQLTCVGGFAPVYIAGEIEGNRFAIAGGFAGLKVSWLVTGVRNDPTARRVRTPVVLPKPESERGRYIDAAAYGQPESRRIERIGNPRKQRQKEHLP